MEYQTLFDFRRPTRPISPRSVPAGVGPFQGRSETIEGVLARRLRGTWQRRLEGRPLAGLQRPMVATFRQTGADRSHAKRPLDGRWHRCHQSHSPLLGSPNERAWTVGRRPQAPSATTNELPGQHAHSRPQLVVLAVWQHHLPPCPQHHGDDWIWRACTQNPAQVPSVWSLRLIRLPAVRFLDPPTVYASSVDATSGGSELICDVSSFACASASPPATQQPSSWSGAARSQLLP